MALDERTILPQEPNNKQALTLAQSNAIAHPNGLWVKSPQEIPVSSNNVTDIKTYLNAFRRHWVLGLSLGLLLSAVFGILVWFGTGDRYTATAILRLAYEEPQLVFSTGQRPYEAEFEIFKNTQMQYIRNPFVLSTALNKPEINRLAVLRKEVDPVMWLMEKVSVSFPGKAEFMEISLTTDKAQDAANIVTAVVDAYMTEVVERERDQRRTRISELDRVYTEKESEVRNRRSELKRLADQLGTAEKETISLKQRLTLDELASFRQELVRSQFEVGRLRSELASRRAELKAVENTEVSDLECQIYAQQDPILKNLVQEIMWRRIDSEYTIGALKPGNNSSKFASRYQGELERFERDYAERMGQVRDEIRRRRVDDVEKEVARVEAAIEVATKQQKATEGEMERLRKLADQFGSTSIDVEMLRSNIDNLDKALSSIADEREKLRVELRSGSRVTQISPAPGQKLELPKLTSNFNTRLLFTVAVSLLGLCLPIGGIILWDTQFQRINASSDVTDRLGIPVIGSMPMIPSRVLSQLGSPSKRNQLWQLRLTESVDGITARLLRRAELEQRRVVMVTSAVSGEGKTTLAAQMAMSFARAGRRTILVDFDLRQPSFDEAFGLSRSPGICEILRNECDLAGAVQPTATGNLSIITAGRWNRKALSALANGAASSLFKELRDDYEFVVVDTSPILPIADARFVSQYVDSVVLCVFRDVSEAPRILAACEILEAFGVHCIEAAVTGVSESDSRRSGYYHSSISA
jgi:succinoglycan biosynthesis transport protein ExoP